MYIKYHLGWNTWTCCDCGETDEGTANFPTNIMEFRGFDSSIILILRGGILMSIGDFPESLSQAMLAGVTLVGGLGVTTPAVRHLPEGAKNKFVIIHIHIYIYIYIYRERERDVYYIYIYIYNMCIYIYIYIYVYCCLTLHSESGPGGLGVVAAVV